MPDLAYVAAFAVVASLVAYALFGGADYGGGVWDLFARGPRQKQQRELVAHAIGPVWEANHVWLILAVVLLFSCFPSAYALVATQLHVPLTLVLVGIIARGTAFTFRHYDVQDETRTRRWGYVFAVASLLTPLFLGVSVGAIATGRIATAPGAAPPGFFAPWAASPFAWLVGVLAVSLFALLAATFLTVEARDDATLADDFRRRALLAQGVATAAAFAALFAAMREAPWLAQRLALVPAAVALQSLAAVSGATLFVALYRRRYHVARIAAGALVVLVVAGWGAAQAPWLVPGALDVAQAASPPATLRAVLITLGIGSLVLFPSLVTLFRVFARRDT